MSRQVAQVVAFLGLTVGMPAWMFVRSVLASTPGFEASTDVEDPS